LSDPHINGSPDRPLRAHLWWLTTIAWAGTIFYLSTGTYGGSFTGWLLRQTLVFLHISVAPATFHLLHNFIRKLAHLTEYAIYASLLYGSLGGGRDFAWRARRAAWCVAITGIYSLTDEFHQWFVPERGGSLVDSAIDTAGATVAVFFLFVRDRALQARARRIAATNASPADV
jgi:VanZ family protein